MHSFERLGLVLDYYRQSGTYENSHSETIRSLPESKGDPHTSQRKLCDPFFANGVRSGNKYDL